MLTTPGLRAIALRPHSIFGPGDPHFLPSVTARARCLMSLLIGDGANIVDFTFVGNVVHAHLCAANTLLGATMNDAKTTIIGKAFFITNDEPVQFWAMIKTLQVSMGYPAPRFSIPQGPVYRLSHVVALVARLMALDVTFNPQAVLLASTCHWYSCRMAKAELGYAPLWSMAEAIKLTLVDYHAATQRH